MTKIELTEDELRVLQSLLRKDSVYSLNNLREKISSIPLPPPTNTKYQPGDEILIKAKVIDFDPNDSIYELEFPDKVDGYFDKSLESYSASFKEYQKMEAKLKNVESK